MNRLRAQAGPSLVEVRYVAKKFLERYLAFNSLTIERDLAEAWDPHDHAEAGAARHSRR